MAMRIYYALYDPSTDAGRGNYWTWRDEKLPLELLNNFYNNIAAKHLPPAPNKLMADELWGGMAVIGTQERNVDALHSEWTVLYRCFNGGHDRQDRPGRYVILTAWIETNKPVGVDLLPILLNRTFQEIAAVSQKLPVPQPNALAETYIGNATEKKMFSLPDNGFRKEFGGADAVRQATEYFASIPLERFASLKIVHTREKQEAVLEGSPLPKQQVPQPSIQTKPKDVSSYVQYLEKEIDTIKKQIKSLRAVLSAVCAAVLVVLLCLFFLLYGDISQQQGKQNPPETPSGVPAQEKKETKEHEGEEQLGRNP
ncbi:hypothetical protein FACS189454_07270 [Planctomycetales bacterium]|nr:hypothetical protein FACS189454_07270 [Planctomycetales bacterium]